MGPVHLLRGTYDRAGDWFAGCPLGSHALQVIIYNIRRLKINWFSDSLVSIMIGFLLGMTLHFAMPEHKVVRSCARSYGAYLPRQADFAFDEPIFFYGLLPPIIFHAGFTMR